MSSINPLTAAGVLVATAATAVICGLGPYGYIAAILAIAQMTKTG